MVGHKEESKTLSSFTEFYTVKECIYIVVEKIFGALNASLIHKTRNDILKNSWYLHCHDKRMKLRISSYTSLNTLGNCAALDMF